MAFSVDCRHRKGTVRCVLDGELDLASQAAALDVLTPVIQEGHEAVVLDLSGVEFIDSTGLRVLLACRRLAVDAKTPLLLAAPSEAVKRLLDVTKLEDRFDFEDLG